MAKLILIGAGPGDPDLITVKALKKLKTADVVLYDALASPELLAHTQPGCIHKFVGKRYGCHALSQSEINHLILEYSSQYECVVRLKGGDPFVFGRAWEEIETAQQAGIDVEVVPGISSALAVPASQLIPLTARGTNESFWVVTGTTREGAVSKDIELAAQSSATVIILMAMSKLEAITELFAKYGKAETPAAIIQNGTLPNQKSVTGKVKDIYYRAQYAGLENPAIIVIGAVVALPQLLFENSQVKELLTARQQ
ncbi:uroporphyrinogen-III C-methyltransferase [Niabella insulamsoli]|uniref:uroporphyrinogen-III C-methyltransferase n=1 Tax=Niabella insulamsoli TaxID=3144874 RepID=UPI0031FC69E4